jgi:hypothetical protein
MMSNQHMLTMITQTPIIGKTIIMKNPQPVIFSKMETANMG